MKSSRSSLKTEKHKNSRKIFFALFYAAFLLITIILHVFIDRESESKAKSNIDQRSSDCPYSLGIIRDNSTDLVHSLFLADITNESLDYLTMKEYLTATISQEVGKGKITAVSVYFRNLNDASWMSIDGDQEYYPGSLMKVPIMIYYLQKEEKNPGYLNRELSYDESVSPVPEQEFQGKSILSGKKYRVSELLYYMIVESDNKATAVLGDHMDTEDFWKIFSDLRIPTDKVENINYKITPRDYSKFFRVLFNATYLNKEMSEYALKLLSGAKFNKGITKNLPSNLTVARKFGEHLSPDESSLSESAIVYYNSRPYLMIIMTSGHNFDEQARLISDLSYQVYSSVQKM
jgi:beta-lactamase class A